MNTHMKQKYQNVVWEGRFQPIHMGHILYIKKMLELADRVWIIVLANEISSDLDQKPNLISPVFTQEVDGHHRKEKNPFPLWFRFLAVESTLNVALQPEERSRVIVSAGHRLDLDPGFYKRHLLPPNRVFLTPTRDSYEDSKASFWEQFGETTIRLDVSGIPILSATMVRQAIEENDSEKLSMYLHAETIKLLKEHGFMLPVKKENLDDGLELRFYPRAKF